MGQCACHPDIETRFLCMKHNIYLCEECLKCRDPELYCKFEYLGNSSIAGAYLSLLSEGIRKEALQVCNAMTYIDFSTSNQFMDEFTSALFLPHTNLKVFPSIVAN